ncbi:MAG: hypothetical protein GY765_04140 [bacterium]|nr:hypothetical protein [bacterium]
MNEQLRLKAQKTAKPDLPVTTPKDYDKNKKYPLFIALHGGGSNIKQFKPRWNSEKLGREFIIAYVQSSQMVSMTGFAWSDLEIAKKEVADAYARVIKEYPVKTDEIIIGGFSSGGYASLGIALANAVPATGFIALCPPKPENFSKEAVVEAAKRGLRGTIITTEMDPRFKDRRYMSDIFKEAGLQYQFVPTPNIGHWFPKDLDIKID